MEHTEDLSEFVLWRTKHASGPWVSVTEWPKYDIFSECMTGWTAVCVQGYDPATGERSLDYRLPSNIFRQMYEFWKSEQTRKSDNE